jgi:hypothetical protein
MKIDDMPYQELFVGRRKVRLAVIRLCTGVVFSMVSHNVSRNVIELNDIELVMPTMHDDMRKNLRPSTAWPVPRLLQ